MLKITHENEKWLYIGNVRIKVCGRRGRFYTEILVDAPKEIPISREKDTDQPE